MNINIDKDGKRKVTLTKAEVRSLARAETLMRELGRVTDGDAAADIVLAADQCKILKTLYGVE